MKRTLAALAQLYAVFGILGVLVSPLGTAAQTNAVDRLPTLPSMPQIQDCEDVLAAHQRLAARLRQEGGTSQSTAGEDDADAVAARGRQLYDDCIRQTFGSGGMGG